MTAALGLALCLAIRAAVLMVRSRPQRGIRGPFFHLTGELSGQETIARLRREP